MSLTTINFAIFFLIFFCFYYLFDKSVKKQNWLLFIASYIFYGFASWKMIPLLFGSTVIFFILGKQVAKYSDSKPKLSNILSSFSIILGISILVYFKYLNFLIEQFTELFSSLGFHINSITLKILMPLGVSYFTFKLISYIIEIRRGKMEPCTDLISFASYISFFPTILAGPIDRPTGLIPQFSVARRYDHANISEGLKRILWGLFIKFCLADRLGIYIDHVYENVSEYNGTTLIFVTLLYPFQIYTDFAGYSEIAIGIGKILGITVMENFRRPFFATDIADFWKRWHISLTSWVTEYVFIPLNIAFRDLANFGIILAIIINMVIVGFWHGANWTYGVFGLYQGLLFIPLVLSGSLNKRKKKNKEKKLPYFKDYLKMIGVFFLVAYGLMIFRSANITEVIEITKKMITDFGVPFINMRTLFYISLTLPIILFRDFKTEYDLNIHFLHSSKPIIRYTTIVTMIILIIYLGVFDGGQFIYFQF